MFVTVDPVNKGRPCEIVKSLSNLANLLTNGQNSIARGIFWLLEDIRFNCDL